MDRSLERNGFNTFGATQQADVGALVGKVTGSGLAGSVAGSVDIKKVNSRLIVNGYAKPTTPELAQLKEFSDKLAGPVMESMIVGKSL